MDYTYILVLSVNGIRYHSKFSQLLMKICNVIEISDIQVLMNARRYFETNYYTLKLFRVRPTKAGEMSVEKDSYKRSLQMQQSYPTQMSINQIFMRLQNFQEKRHLPF